MRKSHRMKVAGIAFAFCVVTAIICPAQTFTTVTTFDGSPENGSGPMGSLVEGANKNLYGATVSGGANTSCSSPVTNAIGCGTIFEMTASGVLSTLYNFCSQANCSDGEFPEGGLVQGTDGNLYGTTSSGGSNVCQGSFGATGCGTVFRVTPSGELTTLYSFCSLENCANGSFPQEGLVQGSDGSLYGFTSAGGAAANCPYTGGCGTILRITLAGVLTALHSFCSQANCADGVIGQTLIQVTDGNFFGTTYAGGTNTCTTSGMSDGCGTVFQMTPAGALTTFYTFCSLQNCADGLYPEALLQAADGNFYGTTVEGGAYACSAAEMGCGTVFRITPTGILTTLHSFCASSSCTDGSGNMLLLQGTDGNFFGTTSSGGAEEEGTIFKMTPGGALTTLYNFCSAKECSDGSRPAGLLEAENKIFYGTTIGPFAGTAFSLSLNVVLPPTFTPSSLNFGNEALDTTSGVKLVTVTNPNTGYATLDINSITASAGFAISSTECGTTLAAGKHCPVRVTLTPTQLGTIDGTLSVADNGPNSPQTVALTGVGRAQATLAPLSANFSSQSVGTTSSPKTFTLDNFLNESLTAISVSTTGDFAVSSTTCGTSLAAKGKCTISVTFTPTTTGTLSGQLSVSDSASNSPQISALTGVGRN